MAHSRPNILFVFSDQHRWCDLGCYGNGEVRSPHLDAFAAEGLRFANCFSETPVCVPARGTLLTGLRPTRHGALGNDLPIDTSVTSVADVLAGGGYRTGYIGKWHLAGVPRDQAVNGRGRLGFEEWKVANCSHDYLGSYYDDEAGVRHPLAGYEPEAQTGMAADFIRRGRGDARPWALWLSWGPPHDPYREVPPQWLDLYEAGKLTLRGNASLPVRLKPGVTCDEAKLRQWMQGYYAHISALDDQFGRLLEALRASGQAENTLVVYTSDHGDMLGSQGLAHKQLPFEESAHVPLLAGWAGRIAPGVRPQLIGLADLAPTVLGLAGLSFPGGSDGRDFQSLLTDGNAAGRDGVYLADTTACHQAEDRPQAAWRALRTPRHLLACWADRRPWLLFDVEEDPLERRNLVDDPACAALREELFARLDAEVQTHDGWLDAPAMIRRHGLVDAWNESQRYFQRPELAL